MMFVLNLKPYLKVFWKLCGKPRNSTPIYGIHDFYLTNGWSPKYKAVFRCIYRIFIQKLNVNNEGYHF